MTLISPIKDPSIKSIPAKKILSFFKCFPIKDEIFISFLLRFALNALPPCEIFDRLDPFSGTLFIAPFTLPL